jgi:hypothetical protein
VDDESQESKDQEIARLKQEVDLLLEEIQQLRWLIYNTK